MQILVLQVLVIELSIELHLMTPNSNHGRDTGIFAPGRHEQLIDGTLFGFAPPELGPCSRCFHVPKQVQGSMQIVFCLNQVFYLLDK